tara:strand:- start:193 stop:483 length:291 start_codon:yes stop_codon:yes gene_type:complete
MLLEVIVAITTLNLVFSLWMLRVLSFELQKAVRDLDGMLAQAIAGLVEKGLGDFEPINPIQAAIANMISNNLGRSASSTTPGDVIEVVRDNSGKFA